VNQLLNPTVPLEPWRGGNFSGVTQTIYDPNGGAPFPGNIIPANRINAVSQRIQDRFYPLPNRPAATLASQNYVEMKQRPRDPSTYWTVRGDHRFSDKDMVFGRFTFQRAYNRTYEGNLPTIGRRIQQRDNRALAGSWTHTFRPTMLNEFRYGFALNNNPVEGPINGPSIVQELGLVGLAPNLPDISGILKVNWAGIGLTGITQPDYTRPGFRNFLQDFQDHISWFRGKHNMKFGVNMTRIEWDSLNANANLFGSVTFSNRFTSLNQAAAANGGGHPYADFLLGIPTNTARAFPPVLVDRTRWQYDFYFNDDWKLSQRLTVNIGLRYELHNPWREEGGLTSMFDIGSGNIVVEDGALNKVSPLFPRNYVGIVEASTLGLPGRTLIRRDNNNIAPRVGLAWRPWGQNTVIRAGFGMFYDVVPRNLNQGAIPFVLNEPGFTNAAGNPTVIFPRVFPATGAAGPSTVGIPAAVNPNLKMPYSMQYNLTIEKQMWQTGFRVSYMGTNTRQGDYSYDFNSPIADTRAYVNKPRAFPNYPGISYFTNGAGHQYHALTAEAERYMAKGLYFQTSWSWARDIGDLNRGAAPEYAFDRQRERAVELDIPTHRFNMNWIYQLPFGKGQKYLSNANKAVDLMVRGWEITGIYSYYSNQFLTPLWTGPDPTGTRFSPNATAPLTTIRPNVLRDGNLPADQRSPARWFDASAFAAPTPGSFGTASRGLIKGPGVNVWHGGFIKNFVFAENAPRLRWELTATNFFNHPNYSNPAMDITALANVGVITGVGGVNGSATGDQPFARSFRMGLRLEW
jgi:hypothetical protein